MGVKESKEIVSLKRKLSLSKAKVKTLKEQLKYATQCHVCTSYMGNKRTCNVCG